MDTTTSTCALRRSSGHVLAHKRGLTLTFIFIPFSSHFHPFPDHSYPLLRQWSCSLMTKRMTRASPTLPSRPLPTVCSARSARSTTTAACCSPSATTPSAHCASDGPWWYVLSWPQLREPHVLHPKHSPKQSVGRPCGPRLLPPLATAASWLLAPGSWFLAPDAAGRGERGGP